MTSILKGTLYGKFDVPAGSDLEGYKDELEQMVGKYPKTICKIYAKLQNIINDGHDESAMKRVFPGFIASCIDAAGQVQIEQATALNEMVAVGGDELLIFFSLILQYAKYGFCNLGEENEDTAPYIATLSRMESVIDDALAEDNYKKRWTYVNTLVLMLWPTIRKLFQKQDDDSDGSQSGGNSSAGSGGQSGSSGNQNGSSSGSSGTAGSSGSSGSNDGEEDDDNGQSSGGNGSDAADGDDAEDGDDTEQGSGSGDGEDSDEGDDGSSGNAPTDDELEQLIEALAQAAEEDNGAAPAPKGTGKGVDPTAMAQSQSGESTGSDGGFSSLMAQLGEDKATQQIQKELDKAQMDAIRNCQQPLIHQNIRTKVVRHHPEDREAYMEMYDEVAPYVRSLIAEITALLREYNEEGVQHHKRFGPIVEATEAYRPDNAFFAKKKLPEDRPNMAMCVLIDQSGSMYGQKLDMAKQAVVMLERFAAGVGVPLMVAGHYSNYGGSITLDIYSDFTSAQPEKDRYTLASIYSSGCNRDGMAIRLCADMLAKRPEDIRLMVVISDGAPADFGYSGKEAEDDIKKTLAEFRRKGLLIYGAAIDDDRDVIQKLYGSGFLSITDLRSLPKTMVRLLRQNII